MRLAVLSDIHGNVPALEAVLEDVERWRTDQLIVNGDLVSRGPCSLACLRLLQRRFPNVRLLRGNHEEFVLACGEDEFDPLNPEHALRRFAYWTAEQLGEAVSELRVWDDCVDFTDMEGGSSFHVTHGSRLGNRDGIRADTDAEQLQRKLGAQRALFVGSHTHQPLLRTFNETLVVNTGSVGQPFDGDPRASYARFVFRTGAWRASIARVPYDKQRAERDFRDSGFLHHCGPLARLIFLEHRHNRMLVGRWNHRYASAVARGHIDPASAVDDYIRELGLS